MLTPEEQLNSAMQGLEQSQQAPVLQSSMLNRGYEQAGMGVAAGIAQAPNILNTGTAVGLGVVGMLSTSAGFDRALGFLDPFTGAMGRHMVGKTLARRLVGALPGGAFMIGASMAASFAANRMVEGQQEYVAARQLLRELPTMTGGFGPASILGTPGQANLNNASSSSAVVNRFASSINAIGAGAGMDTAMTRNTLSSMAQNGQIDTSSVESVSRSFREGLQTLQRLQKVLQTDLQTASTVYSTMRASGLSNDQAIAGLRRSGALSAMSGIGLSGVSQLTSSGAQNSVASGMSALLGSNVAMNALSSSALMQSNNLLSPTYLQRAGGSLEAVASRMTDLQLGVGSSIGAQALMSAMYNPDGSRRSNSRLFSASSLDASRSFLRDLNPYEMADMQEGLVRSQASVVLGRVDAIRSNARNRTQADRRQFEFLSSLGIEDPTEQRVYLDSLRNQGAAQFTAAMQETRNTLVTSADPNAAMRTEMIKFSDLLSMMTQGMTTNLRTFGRAMLQASESVMKDLSESERMAVNLTTRGGSLASVQQARNEILAGSNAPSPIALREYADQLNNGGMQQLLRGQNYTGVRSRDGESTRRLLPAPARAFISLAVDLPNYVRTSMVGFGQNLYGASRPYNLMMGSDPTNFSDFAASLGYTSRSSESGEEISGEEHLDMLARTVGERYNFETGRLVRADTAEVDRLLRQRGTQIRGAANEETQRLINAGRVFNPDQGALENAANFIESRNGLRRVTSRLFSEVNSFNYANLTSGGIFSPRRLLLPTAIATTSTAAQLHFAANLYDAATGFFDMTSESVTAANQALGAESDPVMSNELITVISNNDGQQGQILNAMTRAVYPGRGDFRNLSAQEQANVEQAIRITNPDMARALGLTDQGNMTDNQFTVFAAGQQLNNTLASVFSGDNGSNVRTGENFFNQYRMSNRAVSAEELEQNQDFYVGNIAAMELTAQNLNNPAESVNAILTSMNAGSNTYGNDASEAAALLNVAKLSMPIDPAEMQASLDQDALIAHTENLLREANVTGPEFNRIMSQVRTQVQNMPETTNEDISNERRNLTRQGAEESLRERREQAVRDQSNLGMATFVAARDAVNEQNVEYLRTTYRDQITQMIAGDDVLSGILGSNVPDENNDIYEIIKNNSASEQIFADRISQARAEQQQAASEGDTAKVNLLEQEIRALEFARSLSGAGGAQQTSTDTIVAFGMRAMFDDEGRITETGVATASGVLSLPGVSSMVGLLRDNQGGVSDSLRQSFRSGLEQAGFLADGEITDTLRTFADLQGIDLGTGSTEEMLKRFEDQLREDTSLSQNLIENIALAGSGVVSSSTQEANDQEDMRRMVRTLNDEVLPPLIAVLADSEYGLRVTEQVASGT